MEHLLESLMNYAGGTNPEDSLRTISNETLENGASICIFELGGFEQRFVASVFRTEDGANLGSLRMRVGKLNRQTQLNRQRISDFLEGKYINYEPKPQLDFDEDQEDEIWIDFDSSSSYFDPDFPSDENQLLDELVSFLDEARSTHFAILDWQSNLGEPEGAMVSSWIGDLEDPIYQDDADLDEYVALANHLTQQLVFTTSGNLRFETLREAEQYMIDHIPESLGMVCEHGGEVFTFENALQDIRNRAFPWIGGISISIS